MLPVRVDRQHRHGFRRQLGHNGETGPQGGTLAAALPQAHELEPELGGKLLEPACDGLCRAVVDDDEPGYMTRDLRHQRSLGHLAVGRHDRPHVLPAQRHQQPSGAGSSLRVDTRPVCVKSARVARALPYPSAMPATTSSGKCAPKRTRVTAFSATYARSG